MSAAADVPNAKSKRARRRQIGDIRTAKIILNAYTLYNGSHLDLSEVKSSLAHRIEVSPANASADVHLETDGELPGRLPAIYEAVPRALRVRTPLDIS